MIKEFTKTIIIEGISTSGKSSVLFNLKRYADEHKIKGTFLPEEDTVIPLIDSYVLSDNLNFLNNLLEKTFSERKSLYVFDRLHFTHTIKTKSDINDFSDIENKLKENNAVLFFLEISENLIKERILESVKYRNNEWVTYMTNKVGGDVNKLVTFYVERQRYFKQLFEKSGLEKYILNVDDQNYTRVTREIIDTLKMRPDQIFLTR